MSLRLVIESSPHAQSVTEREFTGGRLVIGRGDDADWQLNDPDMFVSRQHCILTEEGGRIIATDASSGGLFIDNAANPVGTGNGVPVEPGMRLRLGDFVLRIEAVSAAPAGPRPAAGGGMSFDFSFGEAEPAPEPAPRPDSLPDPFGLSTDSQSQERRPDPEPPRPLDQDDPFGLDLRSPFETPAPDPKPGPAPTPEPERGGPGGGGGGYFGGGFNAPAPGPQSDSGRAREVSRPGPTPEDKGADIFSGWNQPIEPPAPAPATDQEPAPAPDPVAPPQITPEIAPEITPTPIPDPEPIPQPAPPPTAAPDPAPAPVTAADRDLHARLFAAMGLDPASLEGDPGDQMEQIGKSMRALTEGVMLLLRTRAQAKVKARVAQTIIASADVNPLKFLATPEDALQAMVAPRGKSYLQADDAVNEAFRDLTDHQVRTWAALQTALRRMIDRFDPEEIEKEMEDVGMLESLIAGGRSAKLWQLYEERYREIAEAAEKEFLGEVGADFRDAYENERRS